MTSRARLQPTRPIPRGGRPPIGPPPPPGASRAGWVELADEIVAVADLHYAPGRYTALFSAARAQLGHGRCLCTRSRPRLVIRARAGRFHLAGWPDDGHHHNRHCPFFKARARSGRPGEPEPAITETDHGTSIRFATPLLVDQSPPRTHSENPPHEPGESRRSASPLALLRYLWERAGLTTWDPRWRRTWRICHSRLAHTAAGCELSGLPMTDALYIVPTYRPTRAETTTAALDAFVQGLGRHGTLHRRGLILGEIKRLEPTPYGTRWRLRHLPRPLYVSDALSHRLARSYRAAFTAAAESAGRRIALCLVDRTDSGHLIVVDAAVQLTSTAYIPADSAYELVMAERLAAARRRFVKPVRYRPTDEVHPDFILTDRTPPVIVEVYGIDGREAYERRRRAKQAHYRAQEVPLIEWDVHEPLPALEV